MKLAVVWYVGALLLLGGLLEIRRRWRLERNGTVSPGWLKEHRQGDRVEFHGVTWNTSALGWDKE